MNQNTRVNSMVISKASTKPAQKQRISPAVGVNQQPQGTETENCAAQTPPKQTRAEKRKQNQMLYQQIQVQEIAESDRGKIKTKVIKATGEGEQLPAVRKGGKAKQVTAVEPGRPSEYTEAEADAICAWIATGNSLNSYCRQHGRSHVTVYRWLRERAEFQTRYMQAHEDRADTLVDQMVEIADDAQHADSIEQVTAARLRVETRKWIAQKMRSQKYGDKVEVKQTGSVSIRIGLTPKPAETIDLEDVKRIT